MTDFLKKRTRTRFVVVHFTGTAEASFAGIDQEHRERGLREIGYHFVIDPVGRLLIGRHQSLVGAHHPEFDEDSVAICMIGGRNATTEAQDLALTLLLDKLRNDYPELESLKYVYRVPTDPE